MDEIIRKASKAATRQGRTLYIFATYHGFVIRAAAPEWQRRIACYADGRVEELAAR